MPSKPKRPFRSFLFFLALVVFIPGPAFGKMFPLWEIGVGAGGLYMPDYRGSDESRGYALAYPYLVYRGETIKIDRESISGLLFKTDRLKLEFSANASVPVKSSENRARRGMPDLDPTFEFGPSLEWLLSENKNKGYKLTCNFPVRAVFSTDLRQIIPQGWTFSPRLNLDLFDTGPTKGWYLGMGLGPVFVDQTFHDYYYRVDQAYTASDRSAYSASGGYGGMQFGASFGKYFNKLWVGLFGRADFLKGATFADSPLVKTNTNFLVGLAVSYIFWESKTLVEADK